MRITAGFLKGREVLCPSGRTVRPTSSKSREGIFSVLFSLSFDIAEARVLDLFAGSGIMSFEAISRGASNSVLVDNSPASLSVIAENAQKLGIKDKVGIVRQDVSRYIGNIQESDFDIIFMDPPYAFNDYYGLIRETERGLKPGTMLVIESGSEIDIKQLQTEIVKKKKWGDSFFTFLRSVPRSAE
ncbi:MAG: 16S rRNA (guanine(966)-N(2))-methyltransferase RsmD [Oligoflexia bacterium]|nr:16S rRNA (guanine(966)-N(2))-methyltransferase RsmD [Oligoflexia bacterium]